MRTAPVVAAISATVCLIGIGATATARIARHAPPAIAVAAPVLAFPGAQGWAATTPGGRGGQIIKVTTLAADGPGSFAEALRTKGPAYRGVRGRRCR